MASIILRDIALMFAFHGKLNTYVNHILDEETAEGSLIRLLIRLLGIVEYRASDIEQFTKQGTNNKEDRKISSEEKEQARFKAIRLRTLCEIYG